MDDLRVGAAQFENRNGDKTYNLSRIRELTAGAAALGARVVSFHEGSVSGYTFARRLDREALAVLAEPVPDGPSTQELVDIAREHEITVLAGLFERDRDRLYNTYVCAGADGLVARHRKLHVFINEHLSPGDGFTVFDIEQWRCGMLVCYDNNLPENVRITALLGAKIIFMPHVTCCLPSPMPGRVVATCTSAKIELSSGRRYLQARRPDLYAKLAEPPLQPPTTKPGWDVGADATAD